MNNDVKIMIELQKYWHSMLSSKNKIEKCSEIIQKFENETAEIKKRIGSLANIIKDSKTSIKQHELDLGDKDARIKMLEERKEKIHTAKELQAVDKEIDMIKFDIGALEEKILSLIDELDEREKEHSGHKQALLNDENQFSKKRPALEEEMSENERIIKIHEEKFNSLIDQLGPAYRSKFIKMLRSKDGTAISKIDGEICGNCNFKIPAALVMETSRENAICNCTNCGRFLYK
jgi:predicted  nucleic acid-binding Zn-ribbon protein